MRRNRSGRRLRVRRLVAGLLSESALAGASASGEAPGSGGKGVRTYVTHFGASDISVIDPYERRRIATIPTGRQPHGVATAPDGAAVVRLERRDGTVCEIDPRRNAVVGTIEVGGRPNQLEVSADGRHVLGTLNADDALAIIDRATRRVTQKCRRARAPHRRTASPSRQTGASQ